MMYWTELKGALLYGRPRITSEMIQPQALQIATKEIARLIHVGWIDEFTEETIQRIHQACQLGECLEIWENFEYKKPIRPARRKKQPTKHAVTI